MGYFCRTFNGTTQARITFSYFILFIIMFPFTQINGQEHAISLEAQLDDKKDILRINQRIVYYNNSDSTLTNIFLHNWANGYKDNKAPLANRLIENYDKSLYFANQKDRGFTRINNLTVDFEATPFLEVENGKIDIIKIIRNIYNNFIQSKIKDKQNIILEVIVKPGRLIQLHLNSPKEAYNYHKKILFGGEYIEFKNQTIKIETPVFCEILETNHGLQLEIRVLQLFEISRPKSVKKIFEHSLRKDCNFKISPIMVRNFNYNEKIEIAKDHNLVIQKLRFEFSNSEILQKKIETSFITSTQKNNRLQFISSEKFYINHYIIIK